MMEDIENWRRNKQVGSVAVQETHILDGVETSALVIVLLLAEKRAGDAAISAGVAIVARKEWRHYAKLVEPRNERCII